MLHSTMVKCVCASKTSQVPMTPTIETEALSCRWAWVHYSTLATIVGLHELLLPDVFAPFYLSLGYYSATL